MREQRTPHVRVFYSIGYDRAEFLNRPVPERDRWQSVLIPQWMTELESPSGILSKDDIVDLAFARLTGLDPRQIVEVHDGVLNKHGEPICDFPATGCVQMLKAYRVSMTNMPGDQFVVHFDCLATDDNDAAMQAEAFLRGRKAIDAVVI